MKKDALQKMFEACVKRTPEKAIVSGESIMVEDLPQNILTLMNCEAGRIYFSARSLKHLYDRKPAEEFDFILDNFNTIARTPDLLYRDKANRRGNFCITKNIDRDQYIVVLQAIAESSRAELWVVTAFRVRDKKYLEHYDLLWSRRDGAHSSPHRTAEEPKHDAPQ